MPRDKNIGLKGIETCKVHVLFFAHNIAPRSKCVPKKDDNIGSKTGSDTPTLAQIHRNMILSPP